MKAAKGIVGCAVLAALLFCGPPGARAASLSGRASTVVEWWDNSEEDTAVPFYQYLLLNGRDLGVAGLDFHGYGRYANDLANEADVASRLYYAYLEKKGVAGLVDLKGGRQFIATSAATA